MYYLGWTLEIYQDRRASDAPASLIAQALSSAYIFDVNLHFLIRNGNQNSFSCLTNELN